MACAACGAEVYAAAKFCPECGQPQSAACASCGATLSATARFCGECGTPVSAPARTAAASPASVTPTPTAERRVCSVLFCDLVGFTPVSEARDPEEVRDLLSRYFELARTVIGRYGGVVEKFIGDAVMAVWGAPVAEEGDAERAVRAALDVVDAVTDLGRVAGVPGLAARAGVVTGEVAVTVGAVGQGMVAGDAVNTAARVQTAADPGHVLVDDGTWRVARGGIAFTDAGEHTLKGKSEPARLWRAERVLSGVGGSQRVDGLEAPLVGRDAEIRLVKEMLHACIDRRSPRLVSVTGPAGVGKSRLGWEFFKYVDGLADLVRWHRGRCLSYGDGVAFWALSEMVRQRLGIAEDDATSEMQAKLAEGLRQWVPDESARGYVAPALARLLGVDTEGSTLGRDELFAGWRLFFESIAAAEPVVLLVEDLHYADSGLLDFLEHLLDWARDVPILVVTLARPELTDQRPGWGLGRNSTVLALEPLDEGSMHEMLAGLVPGMPAPATAAIARQAQGIPLYAVETVRMLVDRDVVQPIDGVYRLVGEVGELTVPETLQSLLAARLDALDPTARRLVADAAVLGGSFPSEALMAVSGLPANEVQALLAELVRREVLAVRADPLSPDRGQYGFVQTMFRQVAYDTLSRRERKARHLLVADHLGRAFADGGEEISEVIAQHLLDALTAVPDDADVPELRDRAVNALVRAAERAERTAAHATAAHAFARAAMLAAEAGSPTSDSEAASLYVRAGFSAGLTGDHDSALDHAMSAVQLYDRGDDKESAARALTAVGSAQRRMGRLEEAAQTQQAALDKLDGVSQASVFALGEMAQVRMLTGKPDALSLAHEALTQAQALGLPGGDVAKLLVTVGMCAKWHNQRYQAIAFLREAHRQAVAFGNVPTVVAATLNLADALTEIDAAAAAEVARRAVDDARRTGSGWLLPTAVTNLAQALLLLGEWEEAEAECERLNEATPASFAAMLVVLIRCLRGRTDGLSELAAVVVENAPAEDEQEQATVAVTHCLVAAANGEHPRAIEQALRTLEFAGTIGPAHETIRWAWPTGVESAIARRDLAKARELLERLDEIPIGHLATVQLIDRQRLGAKLMHLEGDPGAGDALAAAVTASREFGSPYHVALALLDRSDHLRAHGDSEAAVAAALEAQAIGERLRCAPVTDRAAVHLEETSPVVTVS